MTDNFMPEKDAMAMHLSDRPAKNGLYLFSGFAKCLKEAREATGRNPEDGSILHPERQDNWLGAVGYMALLDQIGSCFKPKSVSVISGNTINKSLGYFTRLSQKEINALYALRCAFAHDFSLYNINKGKQNLTHRFKVGVLPGMPVVTLPQQQWTGNYQDSGDQYQTIVSLQSFGVLVEDVCANLFKLWTDDNLEVVLAGGSDELLQRYSVIKKV